MYQLKRIFTLSFAIDADQSSKPQCGKLSPYWASTLNSDSIADMKVSHPNFKVLASLSGWSLGDKVPRWYDPMDPQQWISKAFSSFRFLSKTYHLDGIDMDHERFPQKK